MVRKPPRWLARLFRFAALGDVDMVPMARTGWPAASRSTTWPAAGDPDAIARAAQVEFQLVLAIRC
jgi:hypothetical protein